MPVKVVKHPVSGLVITPSTNNPEWGTFRVDEEKQVFVNGIFDIQRRTAFIRGKIELLERLNLTEGKVMPGTIIKKESFFPQYEGHNPKINPTTGETVLKNGMPVYLQQEFVSDAQAQDVWLEEPQGAEVQTEPQGNAGQQGGTPQGF